MRRQYLTNIFDDLNEVCNIFSGCSASECQKGDRGCISISEDEGNVYVDAPMPGIKSEETEVTLDPRKRSLIIRGDGKQARDNVKYHLRGSQNYFYEIPLSNTIDLEGKVEAVSRDGILSITLPKNKGHKPLKIDVKVV